MQFVSQLAAFAVRLVSDLGYPGIVLVMALENVFPPIPSEAVMPLAGYLVTTGRFNFYAAVAAGILGSLLGGVALYYLGVLVGSSKIRVFLQNYGKYLIISTDDLDAAEQWFNRYGERAVLLARVVPLVRSIVSIPAGFIKMPLPRFLALSTVGIAAWTSFLTTTGVILGKSWSKIGPIMKSLDFLVTAILLLGLFVFLRARLVKSRSNRISE